MVCLPGRLSPRHRTFLDRQVFWLTVPNEVRAAFPRLTRSGGGTRPSDRLQQRPCAGFSPASLLILRPQTRGRNLSSSRHLTRLQLCWPYTVGTDNPPTRRFPACRLELRGCARHRRLFTGIRRRGIAQTNFVVFTGQQSRTATSPALIFVDLTADNLRAVSFDINQGWAWDGGPWAKTVQANSNIVPFLIQSSPSLAKRQLAAV